MRTVRSWRPDHRYVETSAANGVNAKGRCRGLEGRDYGGGIVSKFGDLTNYAPNILSPERAAEFGDYYVRARSGYVLNLYSEQARQFGGIC